ncbi:two-component sensor histidine kinase, partial [Pseudomonas syringae pv. tagetis]
SEDHAITPNNTHNYVAEQLISQSRDPIEGKRLQMIYTPATDDKLSEIRYNATIQHADLGNFIRIALNYMDNGNNALPQKAESIT